MNGLHRTLARHQPTVANGGETVSAELAKSWMHWDASLIKRALGVFQLAQERQHMLARPQLTLSPSL